MQDGGKRYVDNKLHVVIKKQNEDARHTVQASSAAGAVAGSLAANATDPYKKN